MCTMNQEFLYQKVEELADSVFPVCEYLSAHPEVGGEEKLASSYITEFLAKRGYDIELDYAGLQYAFKASKPSDKPRVAVMCEYDALPEIGHGCGHSLSCAISILAALAVDDACEELPFTVDLIGTPGEETIGGKVVIAENGGFDGYQFAIMGHVDSINAPQYKALACNDMYIIFEGEASHASATPWKGKSALNAAQLFMHGVDLNKTYYKQFMQMHGIMREGGISPGTIPDKAILEYFPRAATMSELKELNNQTRLMAEGVAHATGTSVRIEQRYPTFADMHDGSTANRIITELFEELGETVEPIKYPNGSTDVGNVDLVIPGFQLEIKGTDTPIPFHTVEFEQLTHGERAMKTLKLGAKVIAAFIARTAYDEGLMKQIIDDWTKYRLKN